MESDAEEDSMAALMGFSSFGSAPASKKRKYNAATDAYVDGRELQKLDRGGKKGQGSGGNTVPLGTPRAKTLPRSEEASIGTGKTIINDAEIDLEQDPDEVEAQAPNPEKQSGLSQINERDAITNDSAPHDAGSKPNESIMTFPLESPSYRAASQTPSIGLTLPMGLPPRPPKGDSRQRQRQRNEHWYVDYYDPNFNENPWASLEKERGLVSTGTWVERIPKHS